MDKKEAALSVLEGDRLRYLNLLELLRRGSAEVLYADPDGVLLYDRDCGGYMLTAETPAAAEAVLSLIPSTADLLVAHQDWYLPRLRQQLGLTGGLICHQAAWMEPEPPEERPFFGELRLLDSSWVERVHEVYDHAYAEPAYIAQVIGRGMLGAFVDGELAGFIGIHDEGTLGLLEVLPAYRRRGVAEALYRAMIRRVLAQGGYALGQIVVGNEPSMALQRKLGMSVSEHLLYWVF